MLKSLQELFDKRVRPGAGGGDATGDEHALQLAAATLLVEMSRADEHVSEAEREAVVAALRRAFDLQEAETNELVALAQREADHAVSLQHFTRQIHEHFSAAQKFHLVELLWRVASADSHIDKYEEHLVRKLAELLYVPHGEFIRAKHNVLGPGGR